MRISVASIIVVLVSLSTQSFAFEVNEFYPEERDALMQLRDVVNSTSNLHANWTGPPCNKKNQSRWAGITCSDWHVTHLVLEGINLTGSLPSRFFQNLTFLSKLSFRNNSLHGPLPNLTNLLRLEFVFLSRNQFLGSVPSGYIDLPKLTKLELQENDLSGQIPPFDQQSLIAFNVSDILDMEIVGEKEGYGQMLRLTEIGLECTHELPERRPKMTQVLSRVQDAIITQRN